MYVNAVAPVKRATVADGFMGFGALYDSPLIYELAGVRIMGKTNTGMTWWKLIIPSITIDYIDFPISSGKESLIFNVKLRNGITRTGAISRYGHYSHGGVAGLFFGWTYFLSAVSVPATPPCE